MRCDGRDSSKPARPVSNANCSRGEGPAGSEATGGVRKSIRSSPASRALCPVASRGRKRRAPEAPPQGPEIERSTQPSPRGHACGTALGAWPAANSQTKRLGPRTENRARAGTESSLRATTVEAAENPGRLPRSAARHRRNRRSRRNRPNRPPGPPKTAWGGSTSSALSIASTASIRPHCGGRSPPDPGRSSCVWRLAPGQTPTARRQTKTARPARGSPRAGRLPENRPEVYCIRMNIGGPGSNLPAPTTVP